MTPTQRVNKKIKNKKPFKVSNTESNFKIVMEACQGKVKWCDDEQPLSVPFSMFHDTPFICVDTWCGFYSIATPTDICWQTQPEITL